MVWDGDQILHEISAPGWTGAGALMQRDTGLVVAASQMSKDLDARRIVFARDAFRGFFFGRVMYTHGGGIDKPLSLTRTEYSDSLYGPATIFPTADWRGSYDYGVGIPCRQIVVSQRIQSQHTEPGMPDTVATTYENHCIQIDWPAPHTFITRARKDKDYLGPRSWVGSLLDEQRDASGQMYRRNRYYDPQSGRFTQEDPIGIAGGLNVYGYANGDPVTYSDPYGLTAEECCRLLRTLTSFGAGFVPIASEVNDVTTIVTGRDVIAGEDVGVSGRLFAVAGIISPVGGGAQVRAAARGVAEAAQSLSKAIGRNSVSIGTVNGLKPVDLVGRAHGGVPTPHVQTYSRHVNPRTGQASLTRDSRKATEATMDDAYGKLETLLGVRAFSTTGRGKDAHALYRDEPAGPRVPPH